MAARVLVVASTFPTGDADPVPAFVRDQVVAMKRCDPSVEFHVLAPHDARLPTRRHVVHDEFEEYRFHYLLPRRAERLAGRGIMPELRANPWSYLALPFFFAAEFVALLRLARRLRPDVLYAHWFTPQAIVGVWVARLTRTPLVFTTHASDVVVWHKIPLVGGAVVRRHAARAAHITAVSSRSMARLRGFFDDPAWDSLADRTEILPMGVDVPELAAAEDDDPVILFVGRLAEKKGIQYLLPAFAAVRDQLPGWRLVVAGDGPWRERLEQLADTLGLGDVVEFPGYVTGESKQALLRRARVHVVPSIITDDGDAEGLPVSLLEGLAHGKVCIATDVSGADDVVDHGVNGFLLGERDVDALSRILVTAAELPATEAADMADRARETARSLSWPMIGRRYLDVLLGAR